ncbi:hypothetical protein ABZ719_17620 [Streptomyces sp. NPDC006743]|uniref:hypothetical protein n=1 Tax=Streptomyces sp. NPDC006743 TaxID=3154480 RepID=UPI003452F8F1
MTSSLPRAVRPRRARPPWCVRAARAALGGTAGIAWLALPVMTINSGTAVAAGALPRAGPVAVGTVAPPQDETSGADLVLPLVAVGAAAVGAGYGYVRRTRRARTRTTPGGGDGGASPPPTGALSGDGLADLDELDARARRSLVLADDCVRTSREELGFAEAGCGGADLAPFTGAVREAERELSVAFALRLRYDAGDPADPAARRQVPAAVIGRCEEAGRLLDAAADAFDDVRGLDRGVGRAVEVAETRFRALAARTPAAEAVVADLLRRYAPSASDQVTGGTEQAKDRLMFATVHLNQARQQADRGESGRAAAHLRAAEGAVAQAAVFLDGIERLAAELDEAASLVPAALSGAEAERAGTQGRLTAVPAGEIRSRVLHADAVLASVRQELTSGRRHDPLDVLRRIVTATAPLDAGRTGVLSAAALLTARSATGAAADFVTTHRGVVGAGARTLLAGAERLLASDDPAGHLRADALAREARDRAEQDVRMHGNPYTEADADTPGTAAAVLGGVLLHPSPTAPAPHFGGPGTRTRRVASRP